MARTTGVAGRALLVTLIRFANQGLIILSPVVLVHLLTVGEFGRYREFLLYAGVLISLAAFGIPNSLLYFIPLRPRESPQFIRQAVALTAANSIAVVAAAVGLNAVFHGALMGEYAWPLAAYVLLFVNLDFWEYLWLAQKRPGAVFAYTGGRLLARMAVVVTAALLSGDVGTIIKALIVLEAVRFVGSLIAWRKSIGRGKEPRHEEAASWREQLQFCWPVGVSSMLVTGNKSLGGLFVAKLLGPVALAHYAIGTYVQPIVTVLRNSISDVLLPEMVGRNGRGEEKDRLALWRRATVVFAMLLVPTGILLARYAETLVVTLFSAEYRPAVPLFQVYLLVLLRECFDFGVPLRAMGKTAPIVHSNSLALVLNLGLILLFLPAMGLAGAVLAFVISRVVEGIYLAARMQRLYGLPLRELACWGDLAKVMAAAAVAATVLWSPWWSGMPQWAGMICAALLFTLLFALLLRVLRLPEAMLLMDRLRRPVAIGRVQMNRQPE